MLNQAQAGPARREHRSLGETGHLAVLEDAEAVTVEVVDGWQTVRMHSWVGKRSPAHCSSMGKALLAGLDPSEIDARYPGGRLEGRTGRTGAVVASISVSGPDSRLDDESIPAIAEAVRRAAWHMSGRLGSPCAVPGWSAP
jgi:DNA-binding IclR family transcriptional regulator